MDKYNKYKDHFSKCPECSCRLIRIIDDVKGLEAEKCFHCGYHSEWWKMLKPKARSPS